MAGTKAIYRRHGIKEIIDKCFTCLIVLFVFFMKFKNFLAVVAIATISVACLKIPNQLVVLNDGTVPEQYRTGTACSILSLGDNSIATAARNGGIKKVVSSSVSNYFGLVICTHVQGN